MNLMLIAELNICISKLYKQAELMDVSERVNTMLAIDDLKKIKERFEEEE